MKNDKITIKYCFNNFSRVLKLVINYIKTKTLNVYIKVILEILALILFICIIHAPFGLVYDLLVNMFVSRQVTNDTLFTALYVGINLLYTFFAVVVFVRIFVERYEKLEEPKEFSKKQEDNVMHANEDKKESNTK